MEGAKGQCCKLEGAKVQRCMWKGAKGQTCKFKGAKAVDINSGMDWWSTGILKFCRIHDLCIFTPLSLQFRPFAPLSLYFAHLSLNLVILSRLDCHTWMLRLHDGILRWITLRLLLHSALNKAPSVHSSLTIGTDCTRKKSITIHSADNMMIVISDIVRSMVI